MKKHYRLFFRDIELGEVMEKDYDFPNEFGIFQAKEFTQDQIGHHIQNYIEHSIARDKLMQAGRVDEWDKLADAELDFLDLIENEDWYLLDGSKVEPILIPNFCQNNEIVWRLNVTPLNQG